MADETNVEILGYKTAIDEMKAFLNVLDQSLQASKNTARQVLGSASLVIALFGTLQMFIEPPQWASCYWLLLATIGLMYILLILSCCYVISPARTYTPIKADWNEIYYSFIQVEDERSLLRKQLSSYLNVIDLNRHEINQRAIVSVVSVILLAIVIIALISLGIAAKIIT